MPMFVLVRHIAVPLLARRCTGVIAAFQGKALHGNAAAQSCT